MHLNKYKHAQYWFSNLWDEGYKIEEFETKDFFFFAR